MDRRGSRVVSDVCCRNRGCVAIAFIHFLINRNHLFALLQHLCARPQQPHARPKQVIALRLFLARPKGKLNEFYFLILVQLMIHSLDWGFLLCSLTNYSSQGWSSTHRIAHPLARLAKRHSHHTHILVRPIHSNFQLIDSLFRSVHPLAQLAYSNAIIKYKMQIKYKKV